MKVGNFDVRDRVAVVAEIGNNHEGDMGLARELISKAAAAGVDAVKFQTFIPEFYVSRDQVERLSRLRKFAFTFEQFEQLSHYARDVGLEFFSTPFDLKSAMALAQFCSILKISSGDNSFFPLIETIAQTKTSVIMSTGLADLNGITKSIDLLFQSWERTGHKGELALLHCVSSYPTPPEEANLQAIRELCVYFPNAIVGYSDHTIGNQAAVLSVGLGARIIEKHFTLRKDFSDFRDHQLSADFTEMKDLVHQVRLAEQYLGKLGQQLSLVEESNLKAMRRSIAAARDLPAGSIINMDDLTWVRPAGGYAPGQEEKIIGLRLARAISQGEVIEPSALTSL